MGADRNTGDFRPDINGLRAWAVLAVVAYHFRIPGFGGGFVGVDVFFVISGFLMTRIVLTGLERESFSLGTFLLARARRIVPALFVTCTSLFALGWWFLSAIEYKALAAQAMAALTFVSNIQFWQQAGYFDAAAHDKWLLHTWSLSVEWQFYLLLPLALMGAWRLRHRPRRPLFWLLLVAATSFGICQITTALEPAAAFYLLPSRAWELLLGGLTFLVLRYRRLPVAFARVLEPVGFGLLALAIVTFEATTPWPGWAALVPTVGAALVLAAARNDSFLSAPRLLQWIGDRSYSLYLWHWPIVVSLSFANRVLDARFVLGGLVLSTVLSYLSHRFVEEPFRHRRTERRFDCRIAAGTSMLSAMLLMAGIASRDGVPGRMPPAVDLAAREADNRYPKPVQCFPTDSPGSSCVYGSRNIGAILIGDSHADAVATALVVAGRGRGVLVWSYAACPTLFAARRVPGLLRSGAACPEFNAWIERVAAGMSPEIPVVLMSRTSTYAFGPNERGDALAGRPLVYYEKVKMEADEPFRRRFAQDITDSACRLARHHPVFLVGPIPEMGIDVPKATSRALAFGTGWMPSVSLREYHHRHDTARQAMQAAQQRCGARFLDPVPFLCDAARCSGTAGARPLYYDDDHLSEYGNRRLVPMFTQVFADSSDAAAVKWRRSGNRW